MKYCKRCLQPDTRPRVFFNEDDICGACLWEDEIKTINWKAREQELQDIADNAKAKAIGAYDCVVGVSGGKDSTFQAHYARDVLGLRTLLVNNIPSDITPIGVKNIENLKNHGFDVIGIDPNRKVLQKLMQKDFWDYCNPIKCTEYVLYASAYIIADKFDIPLILQGENAALTLGTSSAQDKSGNCFNITESNTLKDDPLQEYVIDDISDKDLFLYNVPIKELIQKDFKGVWLNYYTNTWTQQNNARFSIERGLSIYDENVNPYDLGTYRRYSQLDAYTTCINQVFKYIKFGFGQCTDHVGYDLRSGEITKDEGKFLIKELDGKCGQIFIDKMCSYLDIDEKTMWAHAEKFRGNMFTHDNEGNWILKNPIWAQEPIQGQHDVKEIMKKLGM